MNPAPPSPARFRILRILLGVAAVVFGLLLIVVVSAVGHCSAFGGRCPADPPPLFEDDVFGTAFMGGLLAIGAPMWLARPGWRRLGLALAVAVPVALLIGLGARSSAAG
ncbi:MAG: hypothetical protein HKN74_11350 [Acidimicrobiia bacterium]|nr:hypothetical protein [Acidimicrobiia bacterium]MBT8217690.1 hypothetical protein [Acidimicrobiia bacterium]NNF10871.1 hypothetical protein [Acidimicrobiia bacterium]NNL71243.1 hypothetical protein [Acidimicrobiia bacterium]